MLITHRIPNSKNQMGIFGKSNIYYNYSGEVWRYFGSIAFWYIFDRMLKKSKKMFG